MHTESRSGDEDEDCGEEVELHDADTLETLVGMILNVKSALVMLLVCQLRPSVIVSFPVSSQWRNCAASWQQPFSSSRCLLA